MATAPVAAGESKEEYLKLLGIISESYDPCTPHELFLVTRMAELHWRLVRLSKHQSDKISRGRASLAAGVKPDGAPSATPSRYMPNGVGQDEINSARLEAQLYRSLRELRMEFEASRNKRLAAIHERRYDALPVQTINELPEGGTQNEIPLAKQTDSAE